MIIKACGITNKEDALSAINLGVDAIGFIFYKGSKRYVSPEVAETITPFIPPFVQIVGVFVNHSKEEINAIVKQAKLDIIQLHGDESPEFCMNMPKRVIKAIPVASPEDIELIAPYQGQVSAILLDTKVNGQHGGTGKVFDWGLAILAKEWDLPLILSGGINATNIKKAVKLVQPYAIDLCSGIESEPGKKDYNKMNELVTLVKSL